MDDLHERPGTGMPPALRRLDASREREGARFMADLNRYWERRLMEGREKDWT